MWVFTKEGYFSVIAFDPTKAKGELGEDLKHEALSLYDPEEELVLVRARAEDDLKRLARRFQGWEPHVFHSTKQNSDYPFRMLLSKMEWALYLSDAVDEIDYTNFKSMVTDELGEERHDTYLRVWGVLHALTTEGLPKQPWQPWQESLPFDDEVGSFGGHEIRTDSAPKAN